MGIVPLLRRQFPLIIAFVNTSLPIGGTGDPYYDQFNYVDGIDAQITRLFGYYPPTQPGMNPMPPTQIFNDTGNKFKNLAAALNADKKNKKEPIYSDTYTIYNNNYFGIQSYPGSGEVMVVWVYNDINGDWVSKLDITVQNMLQSTDPQNYMKNFPNYATVDQNTDSSGIPVVLQYTPQQINMLAHMHCYNITEGDTGNLIKDCLSKI